MRINVVFVVVVATYTSVKSLIPKYFFSYILDPLCYVVSKGLWMSWYFISNLMKHAKFLRLVLKISSPR